MTRFYRWLESMGQDPRTFWRDAVFFVVRFYVATFVVMLPIMVLSYSFKSVLPTPPPAPVTPGTKPPLPEGFWIFMVCFGLYMFFAVAAMISLLSGWRKLANRFPAPAAFAEGRLFRWQSGSVGVAGYSQVLTVRVAPHGLYLACIFPFRFMHPAMLIPWTQIKPISRKPLFGKPTTYLIIGSPKLATIVLSNAKIIEAARQWLPDTSPPT